ncbi:hypothetical protein CEXT_261351 [Caerostris extrusa]|uniref:Secreted protein n=1 Tax=Caerostris extrusa TaxID=172846 RepID=A0AAV4U0G9_CAEEX|nr:hypothetical protein CEXT_261351 [Caerostris extrusa]
MLLSILIVQTSLLFATVKVEENGIGRGCQKREENVPQQLWEPFPLSPLTQFVYGASFCETHLRSRSKISGLATTGRRIETFVLAAIVPRSEESTEMQRGDMLITSGNKAHSNSMRLAKGKKKIVQNE